MNSELNSSLITTKPNLYREAKLHFANTSDKAAKDTGSLKSKTLTLLVTIWNVIN